ncbi:hypothetical protein NIES2135_65780 (plasmid) [Leptolyngbya boryana NIES-2135]|jgi:hypothetical protein|uniref:Sucraseferredoxin family protein n=1 Tax=Leptolyngbya boryana NIES-2135 TaxID=1973484 RepID=A0A1Z4JSF6_LEPBY|nr:MULTISPECIES: sucrase ferredoxin [Leptolyngbya]BAY59701.1 hypothetical protein NIES2135_65780 [Leptolyngbya boryana NIES-2135]MBD2370867.1 sucrase ferredoxin [Leptolyngbya sp. FACHB-161]MBD2377287.1 sucrase ferredoxin [Leptolyngbya sp. FACHB-238]MBD2401749.1 sucrase ferredoxin [Leptolyngbya sp. FACHB-239]MBD2408216.1 sucrase ferredoxin [Leptolyngbya sp. FACHB-402]
MVPFFCADAARSSNADLIGTASPYKAFIAVECPPPWTPNELDSKSVPANLSTLGEWVNEDYDRFQTCLLLIYNETLNQSGFTRLLIFEQASNFTNTYRQQEFHIADPNEIAPLIQAYLAGEPIDVTPVDNSFRDIFVCTHGSHDKCCAKYGYPLYREATTIVNHLSLHQVRVWQVSHIGGHRFAPTAIDLPAGRYYGHLNGSSLTSILTRTGDIQVLRQVYRGWSYLPWAVQAWERELLLQQGWEWMNYNVAIQVLAQNEDETLTSVELTFETPEGDRQIHRADIIADPNKAVYLKGECDSEQAFPFPQYEVQNWIRIK